MIDDPYPVLVIQECNIKTRLLALTISFPPSNPPDVYFDTNVWLGMSKTESESLKEHQRQKGFRYRYSVTNYVELLSQLGRGKTPTFPNPFGRVRAAFRRILDLCERNVLPSPEMAFLDHVGLSHYLSPTWIPNPHEIAIAVPLIAKAETMGDITGSGVLSPQSLLTSPWTLDPTHYTKLTETDDKSARSIILSLDEYVKGPITKHNIKEITPWFQNLAAFFLLFRPSSGKVHYDNLTAQEKDRFWAGFLRGPGRMFNAHTVLIAVNRITYKEAVDPNDIYDALQLLLLDGHRIFVTGDKDFTRYSEEATIQHVVPWEAFKRPISSA